MDNNKTSTTSSNPVGELEKNPFDIPVMESVTEQIDVNVKSTDFAAGTIDESMLSEEEKETVQRFVDEIDVEDTNKIINYGASAQLNMSKFSSELLKKTRTRDMGEIGDSLKELTVILDETTDPPRKGLRGLFNKAKKGINSIRANYSKAEGNVNRIEKDLKEHQAVLTKDIAVYQEMYDLNLKYYKELTLYIIAGKKALAKTRKEKLLPLKMKAEQTNTQEDVQAYRDIEDLCHRFDKKLSDLEITRAVSMQSAPQVRLLQNNDRELLDQLQSSIANTIPLWRNQLVLSLGIEHTGRALDAQQTLSDKTNELLKKNSQTLKMATIKTAEQSERPIVDISTLQQCNRDLITSITEVVRIHEQGEEKRSKAKEQLIQIENELKQAMLSSEINPK